MILSKSQQNCEYETNKLSTPGYNRNTEHTLTLERRHLFYVLVDGTNTLMNVYLDGECIVPSPLGCMTEEVFDTFYSHPSLQLLVVVVSCNWVSPFWQNVFLLITYHYLVVGKFTNCCPK